MLSPHARQLVAGVIALLIMAAILVALLRGATAHPPDQDDWEDRQW